MQRLAGRKVFKVGARDYRWEDVLLAAHLWGEMAELERRVREAIACRKHTEDVGRPLSEDELDEAADEWRYDRDLLAADDTQEWLDQHGLDADDWLEFIHRTALRARWSADLAKISKGYKVTPDEVDSVLYSEAVCSGKLGELADRLAGHAAVYDRVASENKGRKPPGCSKKELSATVKSLPRAVRQKGTMGLSPAATLERAEFLACVIRSFERFIDAAAAPAAISREIEAHQLEWTRLDCATLAFTAEEMAREAALLVREDRMPLASVATTAKSSLTKTQYVLDDVASPLKDRLVGAQPGELIGPLPGDGFLLVQIVDRVEPSTKDPSIRKRARDRVVRRTIQREISKRVRWHERV